jgi:hypothetical protein
MQDQVKIIAILWIVLGTLSIVIAFFAFLILIGVSLIPDMGTVAPGILQIVGIAVSSFFVVLGLPKIIGGIGLLKRQEWARILILVVSFLSLIDIPLGTVLGIYSIIVLLNKNAVKLFETPPQGN